MSYFASSNQLPEWARQIPHDWGKDWLKWSVSLSTTRPDDDQRATLPYLSNEDIASWTGKLLREELEPLDADSRLFEPDDVLFNKLRPYLAKVFHANFAGTSSGELLCLRPSSRVDARYLFYVLTSFGFIDAVDSHSFGSKMPRADWETVGHQPLPLPEIDVQQRIARFLDEKTARIDTLIEKQQALLERLAEKRQALITCAVTKGLNPNAPMKYSGVNWLGNVPSHWDCKRLRFVAREPLKYGLNAPADVDNPDWPRFIRITDVDEDGALRSETFRSQPPEAANGYLLEEQDILLARSGATVGKSFIYRRSWGIACFAGYLIRIRVKSELSADFIYQALNSAAYWDWVSANFIQSTIQNINAERYANFWVALPPTRDEQDKIANHVESACSVIESGAQKIKKLISHLSEYRSALITAAVTGQLQKFNG